MNNNIYITLVGGQTIPVYQGIKYFDTVPDVVVFVHSDSSKREADLIKKHINGDVSFDYRLCSSIDFAEIKTLACSLRNEYASDHVVLNITGGLKPWSIFFHHEFLSHPDAKIIYISQTGEALDMVTNAHKDVRLDAEMRLKLNGAEHASLDNLLCNYDDADRKVCVTIEKIRRQNARHFNNLTNPKDGVSGSYECEYSDEGAQKKSKLVYNNDAPSAEIDIINYKTNNPIHYSLQSPHLRQILFNNAWFELKTALNIEKIHGVGNIWLNCVFSDKNHTAKNEIDVIADFNGRFVCVECKTFPHDLTDIDKFKSAIRNFSGTGSICIFAVNDFPGKNPKKLSEYNRAVEKCADNQITIYNFGDYNSPKLDKVVMNLLEKQNKR